MNHDTDARPGDAQHQSEGPDLDRFVHAQSGVHESALRELRAGRKRGHWMWFVLPQVAGLGQSETSRTYGVRGLEEARAYLAHPVLGPRLLECVHALLDLDGDDPVAVLGSIDATKLRSSMTLFERAAATDTDAEPYAEVLDRYFGGRRDALTLGILGS